MSALSIQDRPWTSTARAGTVVDQRSTQWSASALLRASVVAPKQKGATPLGEGPLHRAVNVQLVELVVVGLPLLGRITLRGGGDEDQPVQPLRDRRGRTPAP